MKRNVGTADTIIRILIAVIVAVLYFTNVIGGTLAIVLGIAALILLITGVFGFCGLYRIFGINTCPVKRKTS